MYSDEAVLDAMRANIQERIEQGIADSERTFDYHLLGFFVARYVSVARSMGVSVRTLLKRHPETPFQDNAARAMAAAARLALLGKEVELENRFPTAVADHMRLCLEVWEPAALVES